MLRGAEGVCKRFAALLLEVAITPLYAGQPTLLEVLEATEARGFSPVLLSNGYYSKRLRRQVDLDILFLRAQD